MKTDKPQLNAFIKPDFGSAVQERATGAPAPSNEVGTAMLQTSDTPRLVTRGESINNEFIDESGEKYLLLVKNNRPIIIHMPQPKIDGVPNSATIDFLNCTFHFPEKEGLNDFLHDFIPIVGDSFTPVIDRKAKFNFYDNSFELGESKAIFAYGGNNNTAVLSFSGFSCHMIPDWKRLVRYLSVTRKAKITRVDCAHDDYEGIYSVDYALQLYKEGKFKTGGREPLMDQRGNWVKPDGKGRTLYIGSSKNGKLLRVYEKGMQLGAECHPWVRWELQYGSRDRDIPWEIILNPGSYLAAAYPQATGWISEEQSRIRTIQKTRSIGYERLNHYASIAYGKHINVMMEQEGSAEKVIEILRRDGVPSRLQLPTPLDHRGPTQ